MSDKVSKRKQKKQAKKKLQEKEKAELKAVVAEFNDKKQQLERLPEKQKELKEEIIANFDKIATGDKTFTLDEKALQYEKILNFTEKLCADIPDFTNIIENNDNFHIDSIDEGNKTPQLIVNFYEKYVKLKKQYLIVSNGIKGENETYKALKMLDYKIDILQNVNLYLADEIVEHDIIVICENGIFTLEVKYIARDNAKITEQGLLNNKNVIEQSRKHIHSLKRMLADTKYADIPVYPLIVFSNDKCDVVFYNDNIVTCYRNDIENVIFDEESYPKYLNQKQIKEVSEIISNYSKDIESLKFSLDIDETEYIEILSEFASVMKIDNEKNNINARIDELQKYIDEHDVSRQIAEDIVGVVKMGRAFFEILSGQ